MASLSGRSRRSEPRVTKRGQGEIQKGPTASERGQYLIEQGGAVTPKPNDPPRLPLQGSGDDWREERLLDEAGEAIFIRYKGDPSKERDEFIRDYLDFKIKRIK